MMARPSAINTRTLNTLKPLKPCIIRIEPKSDTLMPSIVAAPFERIVRENHRKLCQVRSLSDREGALPGRLLIALRERVGLDQRRLVEHFGLAVLLPLTDAQLAPQVMIRMNLHVA